MPVEVVSFMLSSKDVKQRLQAQLILQCAPFLKGIKAACIMNVRKQHCEALPSVLRDTDIKYCILVTRKEKCLVFFYREEPFGRYLEQKEVKRFLAAYGYGQMQSVEAFLRRLSERIEEYSKEEIEFPHEIGAFLDYPIRDVKSFIRNKGQNSLFSGYWKVYHEPQKAQMTFLAYDQARTSAVNEFLSGCSLKQIARV